MDLVEEHGTDLDVAALWRAVQTIAPREEVNATAATVEELVPPGDDAAETAVRAQLAARYNMVRPFLTLLGESTALGAASGGCRELAAVHKLPALSRRRVKDKPLLPREIDSKLVPPAWRRAVFNNAGLPAGAVDRDAYVVCVLEQLYRTLQRRDVFASPSNRWSDPRARLLDGKAWEAVREDTLAGLSLNEPVEGHLKGRGKALDAAWQLMAERLDEAGQDAKLSFEGQPNGRLQLNVDRLGALGESASLKWLRQTTAKMLPKIDLPDLLFEVDSWTGFLDAFVHLGDGRTRMEDVPAGMVCQTMGSRSTSSSALGSVSPGGSRPARGRVASPCRAAQNTSVNSAASWAMSVRFSSTVRSVFPTPSSSRRPRSEPSFRRRSLGTVTKSSSSSVKYVQSAASDQPARRLRNLLGGRTASPMSSMRS